LCVTSSATLSVIAACSIAATSSANVFVRGSKVT
jgi:hypothetical protein